uniref:Uncharacterized protein n=1 Tax=Acrobeloides nanus TaxID=290746 RepID=A0A914CTM3_9BILA
KFLLYVVDSDAQFVTWNNFAACLTQTMSKKMKLLSKQSKKKEKKFHTI